jgi:processive 1,2-diacylglycerol beta-glucosyltransferase
MPDSALNAPRILILTSSTGGGHDSRAYSLAQWLEAAGATVRVEHLLENSSWLPRFGVWVYNTIQKTAPVLHNLYWFIAEGFARMQGERLSFGRGYFVRLLKDFRPNLVVSMHDCLNRGYFQCARETLGPGLRTATYCGEWSGGFGFSRNWVEKSADLFVARTSDAWEYALLCGMPADRAEIFCNLLPPRAFENPLDTAGKAAFRTSLGLDPHRFTVLLAAGAAGANNHVRLLDQLAALPGTQAIAFCGKSAKAARKIAKWKAAHPDYPLFVEGYSRRVHTLLQAADCVASRGGANTTAEALYNATPILFNLLGGVMPQERLTLRYFTSHGAALEFAGADEFGEIVRGLVENPERLNHLKSALASLKRSDRPEDFAKRLIALAREAVPEKVGT